MELKNKELLTLNEGNNELLRLALNNTSIYEFYYYPKGFRVMYPKRIGDYFGLPETMNNVPRYLIRHMAAESRTALVKMCRGTQGELSAPPWSFKKKWTLEPDYLVRNSREQS